ncbi:terminase small subunit, partial [Escherichia coli]
MHTGFYCADRRRVIRTIQNWQEQGMPVLRGGGKGNEVL